jgi:lipopolysaccharide export system protein LptC
MNIAIRWLRVGWDRSALYLPVILMGLLALGTYWLVRNTPLLEAPESQRPATHDADYFLRRFSVKTFDARGHLKSEVFGAEARHFPDTDTLEIDQARIRSISPDGRLTVATANRALSNGDGSEVQLFGNAVVVRDAVIGPGARVLPRLEFRGEFLHAFLDAERVTSNQPVILLRGNDRFTGDTMAYDNLERSMDLRGRVKGVLAPRTGK